jgi:asparagine synthase (glutamine-hydrolysing)
LIDGDGDGDSLLSLRHALYAAVSEDIADIPRVAVAFSGGVDSSLLAAICRDLRKQVMLITTGFSGSHDINFSKSVASKMAMDHIVYEIDYSDFQEKLQRIRQAINCENTSHIENCIAFFYVCRTAKQNDLSVVLSANGCDELFCGYDRYRSAYSHGGETEISMLMEHNIANEFALVKEIKIVAAKLGVQVYQPFLSPQFIQFAKTIPINQKIRGSDDLIRKHILRQIAVAIGVPKDSAMKPKKALQYGSSIHKCYKKIERRRERGEY